MAKTINLIIETTDNELWGRVELDDNLIVESASNLAELQSKMKQLLLDWHGMEEVEFDVSYDLTAFFDVFTYLKISKVAEAANMNASLLRHYVAGSKTASKQNVQLIQAAIHKLGEELMNVKFA